jgi:hypothetical protein
MKKLNLRVDTLDVETFTVAEAPPEARGTVHAGEYSLKTDQCGTCGGYTCGGASCFTSCYPGGNPACTCPIYLGE